MEVNYINLLNFIRLFLATLAEITKNVSFYYSGEKAVYT